VARRKWLEVAHLLNGGGLRTLKIEQQDGLGSGPVEVLGDDVEAHREALIRGGRGSDGGDRLDLAGERVEESEERRGEMRG
jgi:hypothetical protein